MKNKILTVSIIFILLSFIFINNNLFATTSNSVIVNGYDMSSVLDLVPEDSAFVIWKHVSANAYYIQIPLDKNYMHYCVIYNNKYVIYANSHFNWYGFGTSSSDYNYYVSYDNGATWSFDFKKDYNVNGLGEIVYASKGVYNQDGNGFFMTPPPPPVQELTMTQKTAEIMKVAGEQATLEMGQIIMIIIMATAGLMVLLVGFKKGLTVLMNGFRH